MPVQAVQEELAHNPDAMDAYAWTPPAVPSHRSRASCLLAACAALAKQDDGVASPAAPGSAEAASAEQQAAAEASAHGTEPMCTAASAAQELPATLGVRGSSSARAAEGTPPQTPRAACVADGQGFSTPRAQVVSLAFIDFPTPADASALSTPTLLTPAATPSFGAGALAAARRPVATTEIARAPGPATEEGLELGHMLWRKLAGVRSLAAAVPCPLLRVPPHRVTPALTSLSLLTLGG